MDDKELDEIKQFFDIFDTEEKFIDMFINVVNPPDADRMLSFYRETKKGSEVWEISKILRSTESLRLDNNEFDTIDDIIDVVNKSDIDKYKRVVIKLDNKNYDDIDKLLNIGKDVYIKVNGDIGICTIDEFKKMREYFNNFVNNYSSYNLSNLEKVTLAYDYVKFFSYNEELDDSVSDSRSIAKAICGGNIVCQGYSMIFCELLKEMGIDSNVVYTKFEDEKKGGHVRVAANINDEKYNVNDTYFFDPTYDANYDMSYVQHNDGSNEYVIDTLLKSDDIILEKLPSDIRYLFFMVPIDEYSKYFKGEKVERIEKYPSLEEVQLTDDMKVKLCNNDMKRKDKFVLNYIGDLLSKTKRIEGYGDEQIDKYINQVIEILNQDRFGKYDNIVESHNR